VSAGPAQQRHCAAERRQHSNYASTGSRVIFLVENYDPVTKNADAIGVLTIWWHLTIQDYRNKPKDATQHETKLTIKSRSVFYSSLDDLYGDYNPALSKQFRRLGQTGRPTPGGHPTTPWPDSGPLIRRRR